MEGKSNYLVLKGKELQKLPDDITLSSDLQKVDVSENFLTDLKGLEGFHQLAWLKASHNQLNSVKHLKKLTTLNVLNLGYNKLTSTANLLKLKELKALILNDNLLEEVNLKNLNLLNTLVISHNQISIIDVSTFPTLQKFSASHNKFTSVPNLQRQKDIKEIRLNDNQISDIPGWISQCKRLKLVDLGNNQIKDMEPIKRLGKLPFIENLNLKGNPVCDTEDFYIKMKALFPSLIICNGKRLSDLYFASLTAKENAQNTAHLSTEDKKTDIKEIAVNKANIAETSVVKTAKKRGFKSTVMAQEIPDTIESACKKSKEPCQEGSELNYVEEKKKKKKKKKQKENEDISNENLSHITAPDSKSKIEVDATIDKSTIDKISDEKIELCMNDEEETEMKKKKKKKHKSNKPMKKAKQHSGIVAITNVPKKRKNNLPVGDLFTGGEKFGTGIGVGW